MHCTRLRRAHNGFTLIELLIVVLVIATLALVVIGRLSGSVRKTREAKLADDLYKLRLGIERFYADTGEYPGELLDLVATSPDGLSGGLSDTARTLYKGPYLTPCGGIIADTFPGLPANPFTPGDDPEVAHHWIYNSENGAVNSAVDGVTLRGMAYENM